MNEEFEKWKNEQWRLAVNSVARWDGAWNMNTGFLTSAETAKIRLHGVVAQDRKACECASWKKVRDAYMGAALRNYLASKNRYERKCAKDVYRWVVRR